MADGERADRVPRRLDRLRPPEPPARLRERTLAAAAAVLRSDAEIDIWFRLWSSRPLRMAWAVAVSGLVLANVAVTLRPGPSTGAHRMPLAVSGYQLAGELAGELAEIAELPRIEPGALARLP